MEYWLSFLESGRIIGADTMIPNLGCDVPLGFKRLSMIANGRFVSFIGENNQWL